MLLQLLDTLPVCRDFKYGECKRGACKYVHLLDGNLSTDITYTFMLRINKSGFSFFSVRSRGNNRHARYGVS